MFDTKKYVKGNNSSGNSSSNESPTSFIVKRDKIIRWLIDARSLMIKEGEYLEKRISEDPDAKYVGPFKEKCKGWAMIIEGIDIIEKMYVK